MRGSTSGLNWLFTEKFPMKLSLKSWWGKLGNFGKVVDTPITKPHNRFENVTPVAFYDLGSIKLPLKLS